jgi:hypothetical protein
VPQQLVTLSLDGEEADIDCRVQSVAGPVALLDRVGELDEEVRPRLNPGSMCMLAFTHQNAVVGLRGIATAASEDLSQLAFVVADGVQVEERRSVERVPLVTRTRIAAVDHEGVAESFTETFTADLSLGGVRVGLRPALGSGPRFRLELYFRGDSAPVACEADLARETPTHLGLRFTDVTPLDRVRIASVLAEHQRRAVRAP